MKTAITFVTLMALAAVPLAGGAATEQPPPTPAQEEPEVLTSGPIHEAFAEPVDLKVQKGLVAPTQPPPDIQEEVPAERPSGGQFVWVPGYWAWGLERKTYIWVSGCWVLTNRFLEKVEVKRAFPLTPRALFSILISS